MARPHTEFLSLPSRPAKPFAFGTDSTGLQGEILSLDPADGSHSALVVAAPMWSWRDGGYFAQDLEILVLSGSIALGGKLVREGWYAFITAGEHIECIESENGCRMLWMSAGDGSFIRSSSAGKMLMRDRIMDPLDARGLAWIRPPGYEGRTVEETIPGITYKMLREDPVTTAYTLLSRHAPGWIDPRMESHDTWEELILLEGDYLMGDTGLVQAGTYIFRPGLRPHGPQATRTGAVWFCRGERRIDYVLESPKWAADKAERYGTSPAVTAELRSPEAPRTWF